MSRPAMIEMVAFFMKFHFERPTMTEIIRFDTACEQDRTLTGQRRDRAAVIADRMLAVTFKHIAKNWTDGIPALRKQLADLLRREIGG
jgi:hypothetical protein